MCKYYFESTAKKWNPLHYYDTGFNWIKPEYNIQREKQWFYISSVQKLMFDESTQNSVLTVLEGNKPIVGAISQEINPT